MADFETTQFIDGPKDIRGARSTLVGIICKYAPLVEIGLTVRPKTGGLG